MDILSPGNAMKTWQFAKKKRKGLSRKEKACIWKLAGDHIVPWCP